MVQVLYLVAGAVFSRLRSRQQLLEVEVVRPEVHHQPVVVYLVGSGGAVVVPAVADGVHQVVGQRLFSVGKSFPLYFKDDSVDFVSFLFIHVVWGVGMDGMSTHVCFRPQFHLSSTGRVERIHADDDTLFLPFRVFAFEHCVQVFFVESCLFGLCVLRSLLCHLFKGREGAGHFFQVVLSDGHRFAFGDKPGDVLCPHRRFIERMSHFVGLRDEQLLCRLIVFPDMDSVAVL